MVCLVAGGLHFGSSESSGEWDAWKPSATRPWLQTSNYYCENLLHHYRVYCIIRILILFILWDFLFYFEKKIKWKKQARVIAPWMTADSCKFGSSRVSSPTLLEPPATSAMRGWLEVNIHAFCAFPSAMKGKSWRTGFRDLMYTHTWRPLLRSVEPSVKKCEKLENIRCFHGLVWLHDL